MRRLLFGTSTLLLGLVLAATPASGQFFVSGSATVPSGDYGDYAKTGWLAGAGFRAWMNADGKLAFWLVGEYGSNTHDDTSDDKTNIMTGGGWLSYVLSSNPDASVSPFVVGGGGYMNHQYKPGDGGDSENFGQGFVGGGVGLAFGKEGKGPWVLATYRHGFDETTFFAFGGGWTF